MLFIMLRESFPKWTASQSELGRSEFASYVWIKKKKKRIKMSVFDKRLRNIFRHEKLEVFEQWNRKRKAENVTLHQTIKFLTFNVFQ